MSAFDGGLKRSTQHLSQTQVMEWTGDGPKICSRVQRGGQGGVVEPLAVRCCWCARRRFCLLDENNKEGGDYPMILYARASKSGQIERGAKGYRLEPTPIGALRECPLYP